MTVFKGALRIAARQKMIIIIYVAIFMFMGAMMSGAMGDQDTGFEAERVSMAVIDRDVTDISKGLKARLASTQDLVDVNDDNKSISEELYYGTIDYVLIIPENFGNELAHALNSGEDTKELLKGTGRPSSNTSYYIENEINSYITGISLYIKAGYKPDAAVEKMKELVVPEENVSIAEGGSETSALSRSFAILPYILIALACFIIGFIVLEHQKPAIRKRLEISAVSSGRRNMELLAALLVLGAVFYSIALVLVAVLNPGKTFTDSNIGYYLINLLLMVITAIAIAFLVAGISPNNNAVNGLANVISLGMSFLCGVFVPVSLLSSSVLKVSRVLPVYWYEINNDILGTHISLNEKLIGQLNNGYLKQLIGAAVIFAAALVIRKIKDGKRTANN
ncbi:MAG: ABC transporter permease [Candidatus Alectryocaccobium sp.]|jgi:ABC-2 type transport system permease protein